LTRPSPQNDSTINLQRHACFGVFVAVSGIVFHKTLTALLDYSLHDDSSSQIIFIPLVAAVLFYVERKRIFAATTTSASPGIGTILIGLILNWLVVRGSIPLSGNEPLCLQSFSIVLAWIGGFLVCYGTAALRAGAFPLLFLFLMVPLPDRFVERTVHALQWGSTEIAYFLFKAVGTPAYREGFLITVPGVTIKVAEECSSIRSSMALLITCLLAAHLYLRTGWKKVLLVLLSFPLSLIKNGVRIATLTLLSIHVDPDFLTGKLHHQGGFVFFLLALMILWPIFAWLEKSDRRGQSFTSPT